MFALTISLVCMQSGVFPFIFHVSAYANDSGHVQVTD